jgi:D-glucuronyl C5-epimerase C-terminus/Bacterial Ig-like domain
VDPVRAVGAAAIAALVACVAAGSADARPAGHLQPVLVLKHGQVTVQREPFAGPGTLPAVPARLPQRPLRAAAAAVKKKRAPKGRATRLAVDGLLAQGAIDQPTRDARQASLRKALRAYAGMTGTRKTELGAVIDNADAIAASHQLTPSRLNAVFATLDANTSWWTEGSIPAPGARISVGGSPVIWQYYRGQGIQLQMLANFGKVNALWSGKRKAALRTLVDQLVPLAADRGGWPAFEYYFKFGKGKPPWTSSISQGTAVQALARAGQLLADGNLTAVAQAGLAAFEQPAPAGVRQDTPTGPFYLIYSFAPNLLVINAHLQALIGLYDFAQLTGDPRALGLFQQGDAEAQAVLPSYDTGAWSMYDTSHESDLSYHDLVTTFLQNLCKRTATTIYCDTASRFKTYRKTAPTAAPLTRTIRAGAAAKLSFSVEKISRVAVSVTNDTGASVFATSAVVGRGNHFYTWSRPAQAGAYTLRVTPTDLAGNRGTTAEGALRILPPRKKPQPR